MYHRDYLQQAIELNCATSGEAIQHIYELLPEEERVNLLAFLVENLLEHLSAPSSAKLSYRYALKQDFEKFFDFKSSWHIFTFFFIFFKIMIFNKFINFIFNALFFFACVCRPYFKILSDVLLGVALPMIIHHQSVVAKIITKVCTYRPIPHLYVY